VEVCQRFHRSSNPKYAGGNQLQQLSVMFIIGQSRSPVSLAEEQEVRNRWRFLKQKAHVCLTATDSSTLASLSLTPESVAFIYAINGWSRD
jgi:hypothetical protein